jgi:hypothetical protein
MSDVVKVLWLDEGQRALGCRRKINIRRHVMHPECGGRGCRGCDDGRSHVTEELVVNVPAGTTIGATLRIPGKGDDLIGQLLGDCVVRVEDQPQRPVPPLRAMTIVGFIGPLTAVALIALGWNAWQTMKLTATGEACSSNRQCRTKVCLIERSAPLHAGGVRMTWASDTYCSRECDHDFDCSFGWRCGGGKPVHDRFERVKDKPDVRVCVRD